jgi:phosphoenolpyruvate carboxykinase (ATP)
LTDIQIFDWEGFIPDINDEDYRSQLKARMEERLKFVANTAVLKEGYDRLPEDALMAIQKVVDELGM